jgi:cytochrome c oxidase subunit 3
VADPARHEALTAAHAHERSDGHDPNLAHHFEDLGQQRSAASLGMWAFLGTEVMFFGGLICSYLVCRFTTPDVFAAASRELNVTIATINTVVLLTSSLFMALAVHAGERGDRKLQVRNLLITGTLGFLFMCFKAYEYSEEYEKGLVPGPGFSTAELKDLPAEPAPPETKGVHAAESAATMQTASVLSITPGQFVERRAQLFFIFYFFMTGLHLFHMVVGLGLVSWVLALARRGRFTSSYHTPLELVGLYWHFIDIVWVFLYPLLYLVSIHK